MPDDHDFGARLALVRQRMGWTNLKEAAVACGQPVSSWRTWEAGTSTPRRMVEVCQAIAEVTGADLGWLLGLGRPGVGVPLASRDELRHLSFSVHPSGLQTAGALVAQGVDHEAAARAA